MRVLADENISRVVVEAIESIGHSVQWIAKDFPGISDLKVAELASSKADLLLTFDKNLAASVMKHKSCGVMLLRLGALTPNVVAKIVSDVLLSQSGLSKAYVVVNESGTRVRFF